MELVATKIAVLTLLGAIRLACGLLPLKITKRLQLWGEHKDASQVLLQRRRLQVERAISLCLCFGGGVLLATCFVHMLPEARESLETVKRIEAGLLSHDSTFPYAELFVCVGFFLVYIIEEVAHRIFLHQSEGRDSKPGDAKTDKAVVAAPAQCCVTVETELQRLESASRDPELGAAPWTRPRSSSKIVPAPSQLHLLASTLSLEQKDAAPGAVVASIHHHHHHHHGHHHHHIHHHHPPLGNEKTVLGHLRSILVVLALSFHSIFEGLAIGLQPTQRDVWYLFTAVSIHASAILFCVGLELVMSGMRLLTMLAYLGVLALVSPLGVVLGIVVTGAGGDGAASPGQTMAVGVLQGIAGGTILYITFFEVLEREKRKDDSAGLLRLACVLAGFAVMVTLQVVGGHNHKKEEGHRLLGANSTDDPHRHGF